MLKVYLLFVSVYNTSAGHSEWCLYIQLRYILCLLCKKKKTFVFFPHKRLSPLKQPKMLPSLHTVQSRSSSRSRAELDCCTTSTTFLTKLGVIFKKLFTPHSPTYLNTHTHTHSLSWVLIPSCSFRFQAALRTSNLTWFWPVWTRPDRVEDADLRVPPLRFLSCDD